VAVAAAGCRIGYVANRDSARLRQAVAGANKTDLLTELPDLAVQVSA
jgi:hypothetical protein